MEKIMRRKLICGSCKQPIIMLFEDEDGEPVDWNTSWEQYLCDECYHRIWDEKIESGCKVCYNQPCERGRDCWVNPWPDIMYLCYVAPRVHPSPPKLSLTINNNPMHPNQETLDVFMEG